MKTIAILFLINILALPLSAKNDEKKSETNSKKTVLIIGVGKKNITSNYYYDEVIAEKINLPVDSIEHHFNKAIIGNLTSAVSGELEFIWCDRFPAQLSINYEGLESELHSDFSSVSETEYQALLDRFDADYLLLVCQYHLKKELKPFPSLFHIVNFDIYDKQKSKRYQGQSFFSSTDLMPLNNFDKQYQKVANKMVAQMNKVAK